MKTWRWRLLRAIDPWLVALPIMLIIMMVLLGRELAPLNKLALALRMRDPDSEKPLNATGVPSEVQYWLSR